MSDISSINESPPPEAGSEMKSKRRSYRILRRKRTLLSTITHRLGQMLSTRNVFRAGFVLLPLAGFLLVSHINGVLGPDVSESAPVSGEPYAINNNGLTELGQKKVVQTHAAFGLSEDSPVFGSIGVPASFSMAQLVDVWSVSDLQSPGLSADRANEATAGSTQDERSAPVVSVTSYSESKSDTYVVNEGGSLWRTGKRFIDDEVLLDKLIDNLSENGMDVRSVRPGVEFVVNDLGSKGMLVVVEDDGNTYESHIIKDSVSSAVRRQSTGIDLPRTASLSQ